MEKMAKSELKPLHVLPQPLYAINFEPDFNNRPELALKREHRETAVMAYSVATLRDKLIRIENENVELKMRVLLYEGLCGSDFAMLSGNQLRVVGDALGQLISEVLEWLSIANGANKRTGVPMAAMGPVAALATAEPAEPCTQSLFGHEFPMEGMNYVGCSSNDANDGDDSDDGEYYNE